MKGTIRKGAGLLLFSLTTEGSERPSYFNFFFFFKAALTQIVTGVFCERHSHILVEIRSSRGRKLLLPFAAD